MKPRTKLERLVDSLSKKIPPISDKHKDWAKIKCFPHVAHKCKGELWCSDCGKMWVDHHADAITTCPYCGTKLEVIQSRKQKNKELEFMVVAQTAGGMQVLRYIYMERYRTQINGGEVGFYFSEVCQLWYREDGKLTVMAKPMSMDRRSWLHNEPRSIKQPYGMYGNIYAIDGILYKNPRFIPILKRNGLKTSSHGVVLCELVEALLKNHRYAETLLKTKQYGLLQFCMRRGYMAYPWAVNICNRNGYIVKDGSMYHDYLRLLEYFKLDTHNAHYICPKNLKAAHDKLLEKKRAKERKEQEERDRKARLLRAESLKTAMREYWDMVKKYAGIEIRDQDIVIRPLMNVAQFYAEGKAMHHCVFEMNYYKRPESLILSARIGGKRIETIEISLKTYSIVQSRGACNKNTPYHDRIVNLMNRNMNLIKAI